MYRKNLNRLFTAIVNGYNIQTKLVRVEKTYFIHAILKFLLDQGYIFGYFLKKNNDKFFFVELKYKRNGFNFLYFFKNFHLLHRKTFISYHQLVRNYRHSFNYVLTTEIGIITGNMAVYYRIGGFVLFKLC